MGPDVEALSGLDLACEPSSIRHARRYAQDILERWAVPDDILDDALVIVSELATNAVRHTVPPVTSPVPGGGQPGLQRYSLALWTAGGRLYIAVRDQNPAPPVQRVAPCYAETGRGLRIVSTLTDGRWGYERTPARPGKQVWASLPLPDDHRRRRISHVRLPAGAGGGRPERDRRAAGPAAVPAGRHQPPELLRGRDDAPHRNRQHGRRGTGRGLRGKHRLQSLRRGRPAAYPGGQHPGQRGPLDSRPGPQGLTDIAVSSRVRQKSSYADTLIQQARALRAEEMPGGHRRAASAADGVGHERVAGPARRARLHRGGDVTVICHELLITPVPGSGHSRRGPPPRP